MRYARRAAFSFATIALFFTWKTSEPRAGPEHSYINARRNAAAGFVITLWMSSMDALKRHCPMLADDAGETSRRAGSSWQERNQPYVSAARAYLEKTDDLMALRMGPSSIEAYREARAVKFDKAAHELFNQWFPGKRIDDHACLVLARTAAGGSMDTEQNKEFFPTLQELKADMDRQTHLELQR
jgi:hypothetical protein